MKRLTPGLGDAGVFMTKMTGALSVSYDALQRRRELNPHHQFTVTFVRRPAPANPHAIHKSERDGLTVRSRENVPRSPPPVKRETVFFFQLALYSHQHDQ
jgi:hypothetical protein